MKLETVPPLLLVALPGGEFLALSQDQFAEARALGQRMAGAPAYAANDPSTDEPLLTAEQIGDRMSTPASWFLEQARKNVIPHVKLGKYVRFRFSDVREAYEQRPK